MNGEVRVIPTTGRNNCGGRCLIYAHVQQGRILKLTTDSKEQAGCGVPLSACQRGMNYHKTYLNEQRLRTPLLRVGERGEGKFQPISWEEAVDRISREWIRIRDTYGPGSRYVTYATGVSAAFTPRELAKRLLSLDGGFLDYYNSYSTACITPATELMYGTADSGNSPETWLDSHFILLWGHNPAETKFDSITMHYLRKAKEKGIPIVVMDPRKNDTVRALGAEWIPIRPATDAALADAMAYIIWTEGLADRDFLEECTVGFDEAHLPEGIPAGESVLSYLLGQRDGVPKTPEWAEAITGIPAQTIVSLARRYATAKPAALIQGWGPQRHAYGEQGVRGCILLACMTGNVGVRGGWAAGSGYCATHREPGLPPVPNPYGMEIPSYCWTDAVDHGSRMTELDGVKGGERLTSDIKMIVNLAGNCLINQHGDINRTAELLKDTSKCEFILCSDLFMTASAKFADILLPGVSFLECENITFPWVWGDFLGYNNQVVEPLYEGRFEYDWLREVAQRLGLEEAFTCGRDTRQWLEWIYEDLRREEPTLPDFADFCAAGVHRYPPKPPRIAFADRQFPTPSGKVELFSRKVYETTYQEPFPAIPCYVPVPEGVEQAREGEYPLQLISWHTRRRCHSIHDNNPAMERIDPQRLWIHPADAARRGLCDKDRVRVWNDRGAMEVPIHITEDIMPGVVAVGQGAWYTPDKDGVDQRGCVNVLTSLKATPYAKGNGQHTNLVEVRKTK